MIQYCFLIFSLTVSITNRMTNSSLFIYILFGVIHLIGKFKYKHVFVKFFFLVFDEHVKLIR